MVSIPGYHFTLPILSSRQAIADSYIKIYIYPVKTEGSYRGNIIY